MFLEKVISEKYLVERVAFCFWFRKKRSGLD